MERSELLAETLGDHVFEWFIRNKRAEWSAYKAEVTQFELDRYLPAPVNARRRRAWAMAGLLGHADSTWSPCSASPTRCRRRCRPPCAEAATTSGAWPAAEHGRRREQADDQGRLGRGGGGRPIDDLAGALALCRHVRRREVPLAPLLLVVEPRPVADLQLRDDLFDDFCVLPLGADELVARLEHLFWRVRARARSPT